MATLEDKILGEKTHCYCSSSESEHEDDSDEELVSKPQSKQTGTVTEPYKWEGISTNTGPKGVIKDWQRYKQLEIEKRDDQDRERLDLMKKLSLTCDNRPQEEDPEIAELLDDGFLLQYQKQRMQEMLSKKSNLPKFGKLFDLKNNNDFLDAIDKEHRAVTIIIHIYENNMPSCKCMNECLNSLAQNYPQVKFCKFVGSAAGMSHRFKMDGVPALLVYKGGQVIGNFVRVTNELGEEFYEGDVENFLVEHGMIVDRSFVPSIVQPA